MKTAGPVLLSEPPPPLKHVRVLMCTWEQYDYSMGVAFRVYTLVQYESNRKFTG